MNGLHDIPGFIRTLANNGRGADWSTKLEYLKKLGQKLPPEITEGDDFSIYSNISFDTKLSVGGEMTKVEERVSAVQ